MINDLLFCEITQSILTHDCGYYCIIFYDVASTVKISFY